MNRNRAGIACIIVGAVLSISALLLLLYNRNEDNRAGQAAQMLLPDVQNAISQNIKESRGDSEDMTEMEIDGYGYIGYLSILPLELELPVISEWDGDYNRLQIAPCCHSVPLPHQPELTLFPSTYPPIHRRPPYFQSFL